MNQSELTVASARGADRARRDLKAFSEDESARRAVAREAISDLEGRAGSVEEVEDLASALRSHVVDGVLVWIGADPQDLHWERDGMLKLDWIGLEYLSKLGPNGKDVADESKSSRRENWKTFLQGVLPDDTLWSIWVAEGQNPSPFVQTLAKVLWLDFFHEESDASAAPQGSTTPKTTYEDLTPQKFPVISAVVLRRIIGAFFARSWKFEKVNNETRLVTRRGELLAVISAEFDDAARIEGMVAGTRSLLAQRLFRYLIRAGVVTHMTVKHHEHRVLKVEAGLSGLAVKIDRKGSKSATQLRPILDAFKFLKLELPDGQGSLIDWSMDPEAPGVRSVLRIVLHDALLPDYVDGFPKTTTAKREAKKLVPIPAALPPLIGYAGTYAAQALLQLLVLEEMRSQAEDMVNKGYARIPWARWLELAREAGVPEQQLDDVLKHWVESIPGFLVQHPTDPFMYTLSKAFSDERQIIEAAGQKSAKGRAWQGMAKKMLAKKKPTQKA